MLKKALTKSGRRILKAIKKISDARLAKKLKQHQQEQKQEQQQQWQVHWWTQSRLHELIKAQMKDHRSPSFWSLETRSLDTFGTYLLDNPLAESLCYVPHCCCHCDEREENQRNENLENEMMR